MEYYNRKNSGTAGRRSGFTLVELLVSISIISLMLAFLLPNLMGARERARDAQKKQDLNTIKTALRLFYNDAQGYPVYPGGPYSFGSPYEYGLGATLASYMPGLLNIGFSYSYLGGGDSFFVWSTTEATKGDETGLSQLNCGLAAGSTMPSVFMICAK